MPIVTQTAVSSTGSTGSILINISNSEAGAAFVDVYAVINSSSYALLSTSPPKSGTLGSNGAVWNDVEVRGGGVTGLLYNYAAGTTSSTYAVVVKRHGSEEILSINSGTVPGESTI